MTVSRRTNLLALLVIVTSICAMISQFHLAEMREAAVSSGGRLAQGRAGLQEITSAGGSGQRIATTTPSEQQLDQLINAAANEAGTKISGIEPGPSQEQPGPGYVETVVFLRMDALTLRQVVTFLHTLSQRDPAIRAKSIELSLPQPSEAANDVWAADVTIGYKSFSSGKAK